MKDNFEMSMIDEMKFFLGLQVHQSPREIFICQSQYTIDLLKKHGMEKCDTISTPMATVKIDADLQGTQVYQTKYHSMIGGLMYLTSSRLDIAFETFVCARYQARPTEKHLKEVERIFRYIRQTINIGLWYLKDSGFELIAYSDADLAGCNDDCKSTSGGIQFLGDKLVSWSSKKQDCTAMSTAKAEYVSLSSCCAQVIWMRTQLLDYGFRYHTIGRCNNYVMLQSIPCSSECKIVGHILLDHPLSYALTATADVPVVVGYQGVVDKVSAFYTKNLAQPWQTMFKVFNRCLTTRTYGHDQTKINILQLFHAVINQTNVDYAALLWWDFMNNVFQKKEAIQYPRFIKLIIADLMKKFPDIPQRVDEDYHSIRDDTPLIRATDDFKKYETVFVRVDVPMNQSQPVVSTQGTHRSTPRAHRTPTISTASRQGKKRKQADGESNSPRKSHKITIRKKKQSSTPIHLSQVKDNKIDLLVQQYEQFVISEDESIDSAFARFNTIITSLKALDEGYSSKNYIRKFLRALHPKWRAKVTAIEESKDSTSLSLDELIRNLKVHEMIIKKDYEIVKAKVKRKSLALKARKESSDEECSTSKSEDEEYAMAVRDFKNEPNNLIGECPKPPKDKNQKAFVGGSWNDSGEEDDEKVKNETCLVAQASSEVCSESSYLSDENSSIDDLVLDNEYDKLCKMSLKIITKNKILKAARTSLEKEISILKEKVSTLEKNKGVDLECVKCHMLKIENEKLKEEALKLTKFEKSTHCLNEMLNNQKPSREKLASKELVRNLPKLKFDQHFCDACKIGKQAHASHKAKNIVSTTRCLELLHMDLFGPSAVWSYGGNRYTLVIVDDYSRYTWTRFLKDKTEAFDQFEIFSKKIQNQLGCTIVSIRTNHGREFDNEVQFREFCNANGITHNFSAPRTPQSNGVVERKNRTLQEMSRTMLNEQSLPQKFWCNAVDTSTYILNRILIRAILGKTPYELLRGRKPTLDYFRVFGSKCFILNTKDYLTKFDPKSYEGIFIGYSQNSKAYIILNKHTRKVEESLNMTFDETPPPSKTSPLVDDDLDEEEAIKVT
ncbi:retrovirus-related pol polyprotein from transposon TNT 1-94 [Tanacetum coccineum]